jgi:exonuclease III
MRFSAWNMKSMYRSGSITTAVRELARYKLELMSLQEVRWDKGGTARAGDYTFFFYGKREWKSHIGNRIFHTPENSTSS